MPKNHGTFVWYDVMTSDSKAAQSFYQGVIGWDAKDSGTAGRFHARRVGVNIPGIGRFAVVADPHGAAFILFKGTSDQAPTPAAPGAPGHIGWHELHAGDRESAFAFYSGLFGWTKAEAVDMGPVGIYQTFATGGAPVGGMMTKTPATPSGSIISMSTRLTPPERASTKAAAKSSTAHTRYPAEAGSSNASTHRAQCSRWSGQNADRRRGHKNDGDP